MAKWYAYYKPHSPKGGGRSATGSKRSSTGSSSSSTSTRSTGHGGNCKK